jgi:hypothetical protein
MNAPNDSFAPRQNALQKVVTGRRSPAWMRARVSFNIFRVFIGVLILATMPYSGSLALLGVIPLAWAAVSSVWIYRVQHGDRSPAASSAAR